MRTFFLYSVIALLAPLAGIAQDPNEEVINWSPKKLTWADYKARPNPESDAAASTTTYLGISYNISSNDFSYKIESKFSKTRSWGLHKTPYILSHEQGHFDIAEIFARKLHQRMTEYTFNRKSYEKDLRKIYKDILEEKEKMQNDYDKETNHSINKEKQAEWLRRIAALLEETRYYSNYQNKP